MKIDIGTLRDFTVTDVTLGSPWYHRDTNWHEVRLVLEHNIDNVDNCVSFFSLTITGRTAILQPNTKNNTTTAEEYEIVRARLAESTGLRIAFDPTPAYSSIG